MYINLKKFEDNHLVTLQKYPNKRPNTKEMSWKKSWENRSERSRQRRTSRGLKSGTAMAKKLERKSYQEPMADYPRIVSMTNCSPSTGTAAKDTWAPEQGNFPPEHEHGNRQQCIFNTSILSHTGNLYYFIDIYCFQHWNYECKAAYFNDSLVFQTTF